MTKPSLKKSTDKLEITLEIPKESTDKLFILLREFGKHIDISKMQQSKMDYYRLQQNSWRLYIFLKCIYNYNKNKVERVN